MKRLLIVLTVLALAALGAPTVLLAQGNAACAMPYTLASGDWLSKIAERLLGDAQLYTNIVQATNNAAATDARYAKIIDPSVIVAGWQICIPNAPAAPTGLALSDLANTTYKSDFGANGIVMLKNGSYSAEVAPGSASRNTVQLYWLAYGKLNNADTAAVVSWSNGGGSGVFYDLYVLQVQDGKPTDIATMALGDRIQMQGVKIESNKVTVNYLDRKPDEPMAAPPTVPMTKTLALSGGQLVATLPQGASAPGLSGTYYAQLPAADAAGRIVMLVLAPDGQALLATLFIGKGGPILEEGTWQQNGGQADVQITTQSGQPGQENFVFEPQGDKLVATQYDRANWGSAGLTVTRVPATSLAGVYRVTEPAADAPELIEVLFLGPDGTAVMSSDYVDKLVRIDAGTWTATPTELGQGGSQATVAFTQEDGKPVSNTMVFQLQGDRLVGAHGFTLTHLPATASITGAATYTQHIGLPADSVVKVQLVDVSIPGAPGTVLAETSFTVDSQPLPFPFDLKYDPTLIAFNHTYAVQATITVNGTVLFRNTAQYLVLTNGHPTHVNLTLGKVG
jgi:uncharacterized lipoprotein YbaY